MIQDLQAHRVTQVTLVRPALEEILGTQAQQDLQVTLVPLDQLVRLERLEIQVLRVKQGELEKQVRLVQQEALVTLVQLVRRV